MPLTQTQETTPVNNRRYIPVIGARIRLRYFNLYHSYGLEPWTTLQVTSIERATAICERFFTVDGINRADIVRVSLADVEPPIGWEQRYTIYCQPDKVTDVISWLARGIVVHQSHDLGMAGSTAFQPMDNSDTPHWRYPAITDTIPPEQTIALIRIVKLETRYDASIPCSCLYCNGSGIHAPGECWGCGGSGKGTLHISQILKGKERKAAIAQLSRDGWKVWYEKRGQMWCMERETVIKEWDSDPVEIL